MTDDEIAAAVSARPDTEPFNDAVAWACYWTLVEMQERGDPDKDKVAVISAFAEWKQARLAELGDPQ